MTTPLQPLPCPFCGGETVDEQSRRSGIYTGEKTDTWIYYISCIDCGAIGGLGKTEEEATERWNKRVPVTTLSTAIDANSVAIRIAAGDVMVVGLVVQP